MPVARYSDAGTVLDAIGIRDHDDVRMRGILITVETQKRQ